MSYIVQEEPLIIPAGIVDLASFRRWTLSDDFPTFGKIDYIAGKIEVDMSPANVWRHSGLKSSMGIEIGNLTRGKGTVFIDQTRVVSPISDLSREPDIVYLAWESLKSGRVFCTPSANPQDEFDRMEIEGGPDLIVEVLSPSSVTKDTDRLPPLYFSAGTREYWIADALGRDVKLTILRRGKKGFEAAAKDRQHYQYSEVLGASFKLSAETGPVPGTLVYTLHRKTK